MWMYIQALFALIFVLALIGGLAWLSKFLSTDAALAKNKGRRIAIVETTPLDTQRKLVLIRRDEMEHLIMIGGPHDIVIETKIKPEENEETDKHTQQINIKQSEDHG